MIPRRRRMEADGRTGAGTLAMAHLAIGEHDRARVGEPDPGWFSLMILKHNLTGDPVLETPPFEERRNRIRGR
ncbi:MAG TPA: hypothetical protein VF322_06055 [Gammaproteobacteria bacterium]